MRPVALLLVIAGLGTACHAWADEPFHRLRAAEVRSRLIGKVVTDEAHWADKFMENGAMGGHQLGEPQTGSWKLSRNGEMCVVRKVKTSESQCFEVWMNRDQVQYRLGTVLLAEGVLRNE